MEKTNIDNSRKVLIAVDGSDQAQHAFDWYVKRIWKEGDVVLVVHVLEPPKLPTIQADPEQIEEVYQQSAREAKLVEDKFNVQITDKKLDAKMLSGHGDAGEYICNLAKKENMEYIVIGTRGMGKIRRTILGSVSDYVIHHAPCAVLVSRLKGNGK